MAATARKWLKIIGIGTLSIAALLALAVLGAVWLIGDETYRSWLVRGATAALQREVAIAGEFRLTRSLTPALHAADITVANAAWGSRPDMLAVRELRVQVELASLLRGDLAGSLELTGPDLLLEVNDAGESNWMLGTGASETEKEPSGGLVPRRLSVRIEDGHVAYRNTATGGATDTTVEILAASYAPAADGMVIDGRGAHNGIEVTIAGTAATPGDGQPLPVELLASSRGAEMRIDGSVDPRHRWDLGLDISARVEALEAFSPWFAADLPALGRLQANGRLTGSAGNYRLDRVTADLAGPGIQASVSGEVSSLGASPDLALSASASVDGLSALSALSVYIPMLDDFPDLGSVRVAARLLGASGRYRLEDIDTRLEGDGLDVSLSGAVSELGAAPEVELDGAVRIDDLSQLRELSALLPALAKAPVAGPVAATGRVTGAGGEYAVHDVSVRLEEAQRQLDITGVVTGLPGTPASDLSVSAHVSDLSDLSELIPVPLPAIGPITLAAVVGSRGSTLDVTDIDLRLDQEQITATAYGALRNVLDRPDIDLWLSTQLAQLSDLSSLSDRLPALPPVGPLNVSAHVYGRDGNLSLLGFDARLDRDDLKLALLGSVQDLLGEPDVNLQVSVDLDRLSDIAALPGMPTVTMPELGGVTATASLHGIGADYRVGKLHGELRQDGLEAVVDGTVDDVIREPKLEIGFSGQMDDLGQLEALGLPLKLPRQGPVTGSGRFSGSKGDYDLSITRALIDKEGTRIAMTGTVSDLLSEPAYDLSFSTGDEPINNLRAIDLWLPDTLADAGPLTGTVRVSGVGADFAVEDIDAAVTRGDLSLGVTGAVRGFLEEPVARLHLSLDTPALPPVLELLSMDVPFLDRFAEVGPIRAQSDLVVTADGFRFDQIDAQLGNSDASGEVYFSMDDAPRKIDARIVSEALDLNELFPPAESVPEPDAASTVEEGAAPGTDRPAFSTDPFSVAAMQAVELTVNVQTERLEFRELEWNDFGIEVSVEEGKLTLSHGHSRGPAGSVAVDASFDAALAPPRLTIDGRIDDIGLAYLLGLPAGVVDGANTGGWLKVRGRGESPAALMGGLDAAGVFEIGEMRVLDSALRVVSSDILTGIFGTLNPLSTERGDKHRPGFTPYRCGVVGFLIEDGVMVSKRGIAFEAERFNVGGRGTVDLKSGAINIEIRPRATKGLGISLASMTGGFRVGGTLSNPKITLSVAGLAEAATVGALGTTVAGATAATAATGGAALVPFLAIGLHGRMTAGRFSCDSTLNRLDQLFEKQGIEVAQ